MSDRKTWTVSLYKGADADPTYKRLTNWSLKEDVTPTIYAHTYDEDGKPNYTKLKPIYEMSLSSIVVPNREIDFDITKIDFYDIYECNYLIAQANYDNNKFYYGFIDSIDYVNDGTAKINWKVDYWATYKNQINLAKAQYVTRAMYTPKSYMLDARRTDDPSLPNDPKQRLAYISNLFSGSNLGDTDDDPNKISDFGHWYIFYMMPKTDIKNIFNDGSSFQPLKSGVETTKDDFTPDEYKDLQSDDKTPMPNSHDSKWIKLDKAFNLLKTDKNTAEIKGLLKIGTPEIYASNELTDVLKLSVIAGEGFAILGCEVREMIDLSRFEKLENGLYHLKDISKFEATDYIYEGDNYDSSTVNYSFSNEYDKNRYREEIVVAGKKISVDPSLRITGNIGVHVWDSLIAGFKPIYSFYLTNGQLDYLEPKQASDSDLVLTVDVDRSVPLYANQGLGYYLSHVNRINAEIKKQIIGWKAQIKNNQLAFNNNLKNIAENYKVSQLDLKNSLYNSKLLTNFNTDQDKEVANITNSNSVGLAAKNNIIDKQVLSANQATALNNLAASQKVASDNMSRSQKTAVDNLTDSQATQLANMKIGNDASVKANKNSLANSTKNADLQANQNKDNIDTNLSNQISNLELQKAESFVTGLNLTAGLAKFLTGALTSLITGFLDVETAKTVANNNANTQKNIIDANLKLQKTLIENNANLALENIAVSYKSSVDQANASNATALKNLARSNTTASTNLTNSQNATVTTTKSAQATAIANLAQSYKKQLNSLATGLSNAQANINNSLTKSLKALAQNNLLSETNLQNSTVKAWILARLAQDLSQAQLMNTIVASVESYTQGLTAQMEDWSRGNMSKLTDGYGIAVQAFNLLDAYDKVYTVQASTERQIKDQIYTKGALIKRKIPLNDLLNSHLTRGSDNEICDYYLNKSDIEPGLPSVTHTTDYQDNILYIRQFVQTDSVQLEGNVPNEALQVLQNALNSGVYLTIDYYGSYTDGVATTNQDGKAWSYYKSDKNYAINDFSEDMVTGNFDTSLNDNISEIYN